MKEILVVIIVFLASLHQSISYAFAPTGSPVPQPADSPVSAPMAAISPGTQVEGSKLHTMAAHKRLIIALMAACASVGAVLFCSMFFWAYHRKYFTKSEQKNPKKQGTVFLRVGRRFSLTRSSRRSSTPMSSKKTTPEFIDYKSIEKGTSNFEDTNILGRGGFGCVYKIRLDSNTLAAVKKLNCSNAEAEKEYQNEVDLLSKIQHPNIISILGYSTNDSNRFIIYELMHNGSLETQLHGESSGSALTWHRRMKIALDTARGLEYMHEHCNPTVIHRDLKSSNILLDSNFNAKISDFGLAVIEGPEKTNIKLSGTVGYVAPEYLLDGQLTEKSDVYAFGVVLLELLLGRKPVEKLSTTVCQSIVTWAMPHLTDRSKLLEVIDPVIKDSMDQKHLYQVAAVAVLCVQPEPSYRPLIADVMHSLVPLVPMDLGGSLRL